MVYSVAADKLKVKRNLENAIQQTVDQSLRELFNTRDNSSPSSTLNEESVSHCACDVDLDPELTPMPNNKKLVEVSNLSSLVDANNLQIESAKCPLPPIVHDILFLDMSLFTPGCFMCQVNDFFSPFPTNSIMFVIVAVQTRVS